MAMSPEEREEILANNPELLADILHKEKEEAAQRIKDEPEVFWMEQHKITISSVEAWAAQGKKAFDQGWEFYVGNLKKIVTNQSKELTVFRTLESYVRHNTLTDDNLKEIIAALDHVREEIRTQATVAVTMANTQAKPNTQF